MPPLGEGARLVPVNVILVRNGVQEVTAANSELVFERISFDGAFGALCRLVEGLELAQSSVALVGRPVAYAWQQQFVTKGRFAHIFLIGSLWWLHLTVDGLGGLVRIFELFLF
jgi:hypothetical protein